MTITRRVVVAGLNADGASDLWFAIFSWIDGLVDEDFLWDFVRLMAEEQGYEGPFVIFDETDTAYRGARFDDVFAWESATTYPFLIQKREQI